MQIAETIRRAREGKGLTQNGLASRSGVSKRFISKLENGANVSVDVLAKIARALDLREIAIDGAITLSDGADLEFLTHLIVWANAKLAGIETGSHVTPPVDKVAPGPSMRSGRGGPRGNPRRRRSATTREVGPQRDSKRKE